MNYIVAIFADFVSRLADRGGDVKPVSNSVH